MTMKYNYRPLAERNIRVVELHPALNRSTPISCSLRHASLDDTSLEWVDFEALSYVWGSKSTSVPVRCDGAEVLVTQNCHDALRRLRRRSRVRRLWIDAVCINQDDVAERNAQVKIMEDIYKVAQRAVIWLGERPTSLSARLSTRLLAAVYHLRYPLHLIKTPGSLTLFQRCCYQCTQGLKGLNEGWCESTWPARVWTLQEQWLAQDFVIVQGSYELSQTVIDETCFIVGWWDLFPQGSAWRGRLNAYTDFERVEEVRPAALLEGVTLMEATDPRDRVFGIRGLLKGTGVVLPEPDYRKTPEQLYTELMQAVLEASGIQVICPMRPRTGRVSSLSSWVPNLKERKMFNLHDIFREHLVGGWTASGSPSVWHRPKFSQARDLPHCPILILEGRPLGRITDFGPDLPEVWSDNAADTWLSSTFQVASEAYSKATHKTPNVLDAILSFIGPQMTNFLHDVDRAEVVLATPFLGWLLRAGINYKPHLAGSEYCKHLIITPDFEQVAIKLIPEIADEWASASLPKLFVLDTGLVGLGYEPVELGDTVAIVAGMSAPVVLHSLGDGWEFMGAAIVPGAMIGELWPGEADQREVYEVK